jgi:hypothetical protein
VIQQRLATAQSRQRGDVDARRRELEFEVDTKFFLKIVPKFIKPFEILEKAGALAYRLALPLDFARNYQRVLIPKWKKYIVDLTRVLIANPPELPQHDLWEDANQSAGQKGASPKKQERSVVKVL